MSKLGVHIPYDIVGIILTYVHKDAREHLLEDEILLKFIIKYSNIHPETLLQWFVKYRHKRALILYTTIRTQQVVNVSDNSLKSLFIAAINNSDIDIVKHLADIYIARFQETSLYGTLVRSVIDKCMKRIYNKHSLKLMEFLEVFLTELHNPNYTVDKQLLKKIMKHSELKTILSRVVRSGYINSSHSEDIEIRTIVISNNHLNVLKYFVLNGYVIQLYDVVIAISTSNHKMIKYITSYFKPRLYSKGFSELLLSLTALRKQADIYECVYNRLK